MFFRLIVALAVFAFASAKVLEGSKVSASIKDTECSVDGLGVNLEAPFKFNDWVVGFKYKLANLQKGPESVFAKKSFDMGDDDTVKIDADYTLADQVVGVTATWESDSLDMTVKAEGNSKEKMTKVSALKDLMMGDNKLSLKAVYDIPGKIASGFAKYDVESKAVVAVDYSTEDSDPVLSVSKALDDNNEVSPSISLKSGSLAYAWKRTWEGGSLKAKLFPGDKVDVEWKDDGAGGAWTTNAEFPLDSSNAKVSFAREWNY
mmetsp:Transcript_23196/g.38684  ORF Transcript_23196/g.38684 Transcript_23196/m.38684 type:complete len:261 (+) Transcript_23196:213-995(+)